jgi:LPPG:FO 2-phospho-L-lactate transferase
LVACTPNDVTVVVNVGDNMSWHGLYICPDVDTILYTLSDMIDRSRGWGVKDDTFHFLRQASNYGIDRWFRIGDRDLAIHVARTEMLKAGLTLTEATRKLSEHLGIKQVVIPASDEHVETHIQTPFGEMHLQEFWVQMKGAPEVTGVRYSGPEHPSAAPGVVEAIRDAEKVVICPANPVTSISPILHVPAIRAALAGVRENVIAVSPILGDHPISGPADELRRMGVDAVMTNILMQDAAGERRLAGIVRDL